MTVQWNEEEAHLLAGHWLATDGGVPWPAPMTPNDRERFYAMIRARADEYRPHAEGHGIDSFAEWLGMDLGPMFEGDRDLMLRLLGAAGVKPSDAPLDLPVFKCRPWPLAALAVQVRP